jgi:anti-sigma regulatory factor (Ser/Thr protein kinase)
MTATTVTVAGQKPEADPFVHEGLFYRDADEYLAGMVPFIRTGLAGGEPVLVAVPPENLALIQSAMGSDAERVRFRDMTVAGRNPARIIPTVLLAFVAEHPGRRVRVIGEPIWAGRSDTEYPVAVQHEALINVALAGHPATILCPYDSSRLDPVVLADAEGTHPILVDGEQRSVCDRYVDPAELVAAYNRPLPEPGGPVATLNFDAASGLAAVRGLVAEHAARAGLPADRALELQIAVNEVATNTLVHTTGAGRLRIWIEQDNLICEIRDSGRLSDLLPGRRRAPDPRPDSGRGLLLVQTVCDLVSVYTQDTATTTRLHMRAA